MCQLQWWSKKMKMKKSPLKMLFSLLHSLAWFFEKFVLLIHFFCKLPPPLVSWVKRDITQLIKGYLRYKTIASQMFHFRHRLRIFLFRWKVMFRSQDIQVFVFLTIPKSTKSVMSWWVLVHEARCIFEYIFWTTTH